MTSVSKLDHRVIVETLTAIGGARALQVKILLDHQQYSDIVALEFNPFDYNNVEDARNALLATELLRKHEDFDTGIDKKSVAISKFLKAEEVCRITNERMRESNSHDALILRVRRKIAEILGDFDPCEMFELAGWGPGVTLKLKGSTATPTNKFRHHAEVTLPLLRLIGPLMGPCYPHWHPKLQPFEGNRIITVPKNAKTDRVIAVEPSLNLWFQKGIGSYIRRRLRYSGVDLNDQTVNQKLASLGSSSSLLATVDFSAASDTIAYTTVMELLPYKWFQVLDTLRSPRGLLDTEFIEYEKFSSMGNGFTFELESLIFYAIAKCVCAESPLNCFTNIYGDDLIVDADFKDDLLSAFAFFGFELNSTKSFFSSYYRESCGKHYWDGVDITPIYLRRFITRKTKPVLAEVYAFHNRVEELSRRSVADGFRDKRFRSVLSLLRTCVPEKVRLAIPAGAGDGGFVCDFSEIYASRIGLQRPRYCAAYQNGHYIKSLVFKQEQSEEDDVAVLITRLYQLWKRQSAEGEVVLGNKVDLPRRGRYTIKRVYVRDWPQLGYWI